MPLSTTCDGLLQPSLLTASISPMVPPLPSPHHLAEADQGSPATPDHEGVPKYSPKPLSAGPPEEVCDREQSPQCPLDGSAQMLNTETSSNLASPPAIPLFFCAFSEGLPTIFINAAPTRCCTGVRVHTAVSSSHTQHHRICPKF